MYKTERVSPSVCVFAMCVRVSCSITVKLAMIAKGIGDQVIA